MIRAGMLRLPFLCGWSGFERLHAYDSLHLSLHHRYAPGPHWYLWLIGVEPQHQGKGVAGELMWPVIALADQAGLPCYLETHKETNVPIYERQGFRVQVRAEPPDRPVRVWSMLRPAAPADQSAAHPVNASHGPEPLS